MTLSGTSVGTESVLENLCGDATPFVSVLDYNNCPISAAFPAITCTPSDCEPLRTYTIGGWGAKTTLCTSTFTLTAKQTRKEIEDVENNVKAGSESVGPGNSPAVQYLQANFSNVFPNGLTIGNGSNYIKLTSACAITNFLPASGPSTALSGSLTNPTGVKNTLAGQICAATLSVVFDSHDADFAAAAGTLGNRYVASGAFAGMTVSQVLAEANKKIGGAYSPFSLADLNVALTAINQNYDNGDGTDNHFLVCTAPAGRLASLFDGELFPNPAAESSTIKVEASKGEILRVIVADFMGRILFESTSITSTGVNQVELPLSGITAKQCIVRVTKGSETFSKILYIGK